MSSSQSQPGQRGVQPIHGNLAVCKDKIKIQAVQGQKLRCKLKGTKGQSGRKAWTSLSSSINTDIYKTQSQESERGKEETDGMWDQVMVGDSSFLYWTQDLKLRPSKHTTGFWLFLLILTGPWKSGWEVKPHPGHRWRHPAPVTNRTACACWCHHLKGAGSHVRTARLAALPPWLDTKGPGLTGFTPPYPLKNTDPFHLTHVRRGPIWGKEYSSGFRKPWVRVPALLCPSWRTFLLPSLTKSNSRPLLTRLLGVCQALSTALAHTVNQQRFIILIPIIIIQHGRD